MKACYLLLTCSFIAMIASADTLTVYPAPGGSDQNTDFLVKVRLPGKEWQELPEYLVKVDHVRGVDHTWTNSSVSTFDFSGDVVVSVTSNRGPIQSARIRLLSYGIRPVTMRTEKSRMWSLKIWSSMARSSRMIWKSPDGIRPRTWHVFSSASMSKAWNFVLMRSSPTNSKKF